jgi:hypothetical protein
VIRDQTCIFRQIGVPLIKPLSIACETAYSIDIMKRKMPIATSSAFGAGPAAQWS